MKYPRALLLVALLAFTPIIADAQTVVCCCGGGAGTPGEGTVTSVAATVPAFMAVSGSPITGAGTLAFSFASQAQNLVLASPDGLAGSPTFRSLVSADLPATITGLTAVTATTFTGALTGNASTSTALAANGTNCGAGNYPLGVDASGNAEDCTAAGGGGGATTALDNLAAVAINADLVTGAGTVARLTATAPAQAAGSQGGTNTIITASVAVDGSSTHAAAQGGFVGLVSGAGVNAGNRGQVQVAGTGTASAPIFCLNATIGSLCQDGLWYDGQGIAVAKGGNSVASFRGGLSLASTGQIAISSNSDPANSTTRIASGGTKHWMFGDPNDPGSVQDYRLSGIIATGTNTAGSDVTISTGRATGGGVPADINIQTSVLGSSGTTAQAWGDRVFVRGAPKTLTESSATGLADIAIPSGTITGGTIFFTVEANDGTDFQVVRGKVEFTTVNKAGALTVTDNTTAGTPANQAPCACSTGTLTTAFTASAGTNTITLNLNAVSSLTQTTLRASWSVLLDGGAATVSPLS